MTSEKNEIISIPIGKFKILSQYFYSIGVGVGPMHIERAALYYLYTRYIDYIYDDEDWEADANNVLDLFRAIGRSAAALAIQDGSRVVRHQDMQYATTKVEGEMKSCIEKIQAQEKEARAEPLGRYCP